jgi:hypothetical protein
MSGIVRCEILEQWRDQNGHEVVRVTTEQPDYVETKEGVTQFVVFASQVVTAAATIAEMERKVIACEDRARAEPSRAEALLREAETYREWIASLAQGGHWPSPKTLQ